MKAALLAVWEEACSTAACICTTQQGSPSFASVEWKAICVSHVQPLTSVTQVYLLTPGR